MGNEQNIGGVRVWVTGPSYGHVESLSPATARMVDSHEQLQAQLATANADLDLCTAAHARLGRELEEARAERNTWKANHDNQVKLRRELMDRPDLGDRAKSLRELHAHIDRLTEFVFQVAHSQTNGDPALVATQMLAALTNHDTTGGASDAG